MNRARSSHSSGVVTVVLLQQQPLDEIEHRARLIAGARRLADRTASSDVAAVVLADRLVGGDVGPVDREAGDHFLQRRDQAVEREVAEVTVALGEAIQLMAERVDVARHRLVQHLLLAAVDEIVERQPRAFADEAPVDVVEGALVAAIDEQVVHDGGELVAGRAVHRPVARQLLAGAEDLLDDDEERVAGRRRRSAPAGGAGSRRARTDRRRDRCAGRWPRRAAPARTRSGAPRRTPPDLPSAARRAGSRRRSAGS